MRDRQSTIESIRSLNPTASPEFLEGFEFEDLAAYLNRLRDAERHRHVEYADENRSVITNFDHRAVPV